MKTEVITDLAQVDRAAALAQALVTLYSRQNDRFELGANARRKAESRLNWRWNAIEVCALVKRGGPAPARSAKRSTYEGSP